MHSIGELNGQYSTETDEIPNLIKKHIHII